MLFLILEMRNLEVEILKLEIRNLEVEVLKPSPHNTPLFKDRKSSGPQTDSTYKHIHISFSISYHPQNQIMNKEHEEKQDSETEGEYNDIGKKYEVNGMKITSNNNNTQSRQSQSTGEVKITRVEELERIINENSYVIDEEKIIKHLEKFFKSLRQEEEFYKAGEVEIKYSGELVPDVIRLVSAGTKVLDAILYSLLGNDKSSRRIFSFVQVTDLTNEEVAQNIVKSKRAFLSAIVLLFVQGYLPSRSGEDKRSVPLFLNKEIYTGEPIDSLTSIGKNLSVAPTSKFPAKVLLNIDVNILPVPLATRCKLYVSGNKAVRYARYVASCEKRQENEIKNGDDLATVTKKFEDNNRLKLAKGITDFLATLIGNMKAQLRVHPQSPNRPTIKNFSLKLTNAILHTLSPAGRQEMVAKIDRDKREAFKKDENLYGVVRNGVRYWDVLSNAEADFAELSVLTLKIVYGVS
nr:TPA_asm: coat protein [Erigeron ophiovirus]